MVGVTLKANPVYTLGSYNVLMQQPLTKYLLGRDGPRFGNDGGNVTAVIESHYDAKSFFNVTDVNDNTRTIGAPITADPTDAAYFMHWSCPLGSGAAAMYVAYEVEYDVVFSEPATLLGS